MKKNYTHEHFELVAAVIASIANVDTRKVLCEEWSLKLAKTNKNFRHSRFHKACGIEEKQRAENEKVLHKAGQTLAEANYTNFC
tara:strand:- start:915 stop:1166 length:252 start_codon:yes stop_codon:yes gene_type:complete